jgi:HAD superfamily hydrolase (TIGR01509 family)
MYQAVLFDMDGVVVDTLDSVQEFWQRLAHEGGYSLSLADLEEHVYGHHADHTLRALFPQISPTRYDEVYRRLRHDQENIFYRPIPGVLRLLDQLREAEVPLALVTGAQSWKVAEVLSQLHLRATFNASVCADDVPTGKPDPTCYLHAAKCLSIDITRCLVFEDAVSGVAAAMAAGADCVAIVPPYRVNDVLAAGALTFTHDFTEIDFYSNNHVLRVADKARLQFQEMR